MCVFALLLAIRDDRTQHHSRRPPSIAGIDVKVEGGQNLVAIFAQWGLIQLLLAGERLDHHTSLRYQGLIPLILLISALEQFGRIAVGCAKPIRVDRPPSGVRGSIVLTPLIACALWRSLPEE